MDFADIDVDKIRGRIIRNAAWLEQRLRKMGGEGQGLKELSESLGSRLGEQEQDLMRHVVRIRNVMAHSATLEELKSDDLELFDTCYSQLTQSLESHGGNRPVGAIERVLSGKTTLTDELAKKSSELLQDGVGFLFDSIFRR